LLAAAPGARGRLRGGDPHDQEADAAPAIDAVVLVDRHGRLRTNSTGRPREGSSRDGYYHPCCRAQTIMASDPATPATYASTNRVIQSGRVAASASGRLGAKPLLGRVDCRKVSGSLHGPPMTNPS